MRKAAEEISALGRRSLAHTCDVTDEASIEKLLAAVLKEFGSVEILVNCAGRTKRTPTLEVPDAEWNGILDTNLNGTLRACRVFGRHMIERRYGRIVNIASLASLVALMEVAAYCASKAAVAALTKSLAIEGGTKGVWVNAIGRLRECDCSGSFSNGVECGIIGWHGAGEGISAAHADASVRAARRIGGSGGVFGVGCGELCDRACAGGGWGIFGQRSESVEESTTHLAK